jgi:MarR family transcriptional regulator, transcriptional regulator for hemolysin
MRPTGTPIGLKLFQSSKAVRRAFADALAEAGGSLPLWLVLTSLKGNEWPSQSDLAASVGIEGPTLTRHLDAFEQRGLVRRRPDPANRRASLVELTPEGHAMHARLREVVIAFDRRLRAGLSQEDVERLRELLGRLEENVGETRPRG